MVIEWLKNRYSLSDGNNVFERQNSALEFVWIWSIFEKGFLFESPGFFSYSKQLQKLAKIITVNNSELNTIYSKLHNRYYINKELSEFYGNLNFDKKWNNICKKILAEKEPSIEEKLRLVLLVIYKYRCNLFHGGKSPLVLGKFEHIFLLINKFLCHAVDENTDLKNIRKTLKNNLEDRKN